MTQTMMLHQIEEFGTPRQREIALKYVTYGKLDSLRALYREVVGHV